MDERFRRIRRRILEYCYRESSNPYIGPETFAFVYQIEFESEFSGNSDVMDDLWTMGLALYKAMRAFEQQRPQSLDRFLASRIKQDFLILQRAYIETAIKDS
jgi:hypothetical protein